MATNPDAARQKEAGRHAAEAQRLLEAAGQSIFRGADPWVLTRDQALMRAATHASLAVYYSQLTLDELARQVDRLVPGEG
jgi:hypothetical protein